MGYTLLLDLHPSLVVTALPPGPSWLVPSVAGLVHPLFPLSGVLFPHLVSIWRIPSAPSSQGPLLTEVFSDHSIYHLSIYLSIYLSIIYLSII